MGCANVDKCTYLTCRTWFSINAVCCVSFGTAKRSLVFNLVIFPVEWECWTQKDWTLCLREITLSSLQQNYNAPNTPCDWHWTRRREQMKSCPILTHVAWRVACCVQWRWGLNTGKCLSESSIEHLEFGWSCKETMYLRGLSLGVEISEFFNVQFAITVLVKLLQQKHHLRKNKNQNQLLLFEFFFLTIWPN